MRSALRCLSMLAVLAATRATAASAQTPDGMESNRIVSVGIGGGVSVPMSDARDAFKNGFNGQGFVRLNLGMLPVAPRLDFTFSQFDLNDAKVGTTGTGTVLAGLANLQLYLLHNGPLRPYIVAGVGAYNVKTETDGASGESVSDTRFGVNGGAGLVLKLGHLLSAYAEGRVDNVYTEKGLIDTKQVQVVPVTFGVVF